MNLELERTEPCHEILDSTLKQSLGEDYFSELTKEELVEQLILGDNPEVNCYNKLCSFLEKALVPQEGEGTLIFAPTTKALRFYRNYFRKQLADVMFVGVNDPDDPEKIIN